MISGLNGIPNVFPAWVSLVRGSAISTILAGSLAQAQVLVIEPGGEWPRPAAAAATPDTSQPREMMVSPAAEPVPAVHVRFWLDQEQRRRGNAMVHVQRALLMRAENPQRAEREREYVDRSEQWVGGELTEMPQEEVRAYLTSFRNVLNELYQIPTAETAEYDFRFDQLPGTGVFGVMLPEIQATRELARLLWLDIRLALAEGRHDDALRGFQAAFRLGEITGSATPAIVGKLVGMAIIDNTLEELRHAITLPDAPNYYWALATLPDSLWEIRPAIRYEMAAVPRVFGAGEALPVEPLEPSAWRERLLEALRAFERLDSDSALDSPEQPAANAASRLGLGLLMLAADGLARRYLERNGIESTGMCPSEAIIRAVNHDMIRTRDEQLKWLLLPESLGRRLLPDMFDSMTSFDPLDYRPLDPRHFAVAPVLMARLYPAVDWALDAGMRGRQTVAVLATVEALRMHAASHGEFPECLEQLDPVPAWPDPAVNEPFSYQRRSPTEAVIKRSAQLRGWSPPDLILKLREN